MKELIILAQDNVPWMATTVLFLSIFFEFSKIKINPLSWMFKNFSKKVTADIHKENEVIHKENEDINKRLDEVVYVKSKHYEEIVKWHHDIDCVVKNLGMANDKVMDAIDRINQKLDDINKAQDENEMVRLRWEILSFADSIRSGNKHSKDAFHHIIENNDKYHRIIDKRGFSNGVIDAEMEYIMEIYREHRDNDDF